METLAAEYRSARDKLLSHRGNRFQRRRLVRVDCPRYHGLGTVELDDACPPDSIPVLLGNGNTWWYPVESVVPFDGPMPRELRHMVLMKAGIHYL